MKKKVEFKPDSAGGSLLRRLYLTKKQRQQGLKWFLYVAVCILGLVLQDVLLSRMRLFGAATDLVPCLLMLICVIQGAESGGTFALCASLVYYFSGSAPGVYVIFLIPLLGILVSLFRQSYLRKGFNSTLLCADTGILFYELAVFALGLVTGRTVPSRIVMFGISAALCLVTVPVLYPIVLSIGKIGGETWKE